MEIHKFQTPHFKQLKSVAVRIDYAREGEAFAVKGSGILYKPQGEFYVITAAHVLIDDKNNVLPIEDFRLSLPILEENGYFKIIELKRIDVAEDIDFALLKVNYKPSSLNSFDYDAGLCFVGEDIEQSGYVGIVGFRAHEEKGEIQKAECTAHRIYQFDKSYTAESKTPELLKGYSGAGLYLNDNGRLYCMGYVVKIAPEYSHLDSFEIRYIPDLGDPIIWHQSVDEFILLPNKSYGNNSAQREYYKVWRELLNCISDKEIDQQKYSELIQKIKEAKIRYPYPKSIDIQEYVIQRLFRNHINFPSSLDEQKKDVSWTEYDKETLLLALEDLGQWPQLYGQLPDGLNDLSKNPNAQKVLNRTTTLTGHKKFEAILPDSNTDHGCYELIMRAAFQLDFTEMKKLTFSWNPKDDAYVAKRAILGSLWNENRDYREKYGKESPIMKRLKNLIQSNGICVEEKFIATVIYNICNSVYPNEFSYEQFQKDGLDSPSEVIQYITDKIDKAKEDCVPYGIHVTHILGGEDTTSFPASLKLVQYLINTGLLTSNPWREIVSAPIWYKVFRHLYRDLPPACFFYTLLYHNEKLVVKCGQDIAYTDDEYVVKQRPLYLRLINRALLNPDTPQRIIESALLIATQLFQAVYEAEWFEDFSKVAVYMLETIPFENVSYRDSVFKYLEEGISHVNDVAHKIIIFKEVSARLSKNPLLLSYLLGGSLDFDETMMEDKEVSFQLDSLSQQYKLQILHPVYQALNNKELIPQSIRDFIENKAKEEGLEFAKGDSNAMRLLSYLLISPENVTKLKDIILQSDIWNCGVNEAATSFTDPSAIELERFNDLNWATEEKVAIAENMAKNLGLMESVDPNRPYRTHFIGQYVNLLGGMRHFLTKQSNTDFPNKESLMERIENLLCKWSDASNLKEMLISKDYNTLSQGISLLVSHIEHGNPEDYLEEIRIIIDSVILQTDTALSSSMAFVGYMVKKYPVIMRDTFTASLKLIQKSYQEWDYEQTNVKVIEFRQHLANICNFNRTIASKETE